MGKKRSEAGKGTTADEEETIPKRSPSVREVDFAAPKDDKGIPGLSPDFERIVESTFIDDVAHVYEELEKNLQIGEQRTDFASVTKHLDQCEMNARKAHKLSMTAKVVAKRYDIESEIVLSAIRSKATAECTREKETGARTKQITDADITSKMAELHPDEWLHIEQKRQKVSLMSKSCEHLADLWMSRCASARSILDKVRR